MPCKSVGSIKMSIVYQLFGIPIPNQYLLGIWYFNPNMFGLFGLEIFGNYINSLAEELVTLIYT